MKSNNNSYETQAAQLAELERIIQAGADSLEATRMALLEVQKQGLYRAGYPTFYSYTRQRWGFNRDSDSRGGDQCWPAGKATYQRKDRFSPTLAGLTRAAHLCDHLLTLCQFSSCRFGAEVAEELREQLDATAAFCIGEMHPDSTVVDADNWSSETEPRE